MPNFGSELVLWRLPVSAGRRGVTTDELGLALASDPDFINEVQSSLSLPVNVKSEGATGDGVTDDTAAIQTTLDNIPATGGVVVFPEGTYRVSAALTTSNKSIYFVGEGINVTTILWDAASGSTGLSISQSSTAFWTGIAAMTLATEQAGSGSAITITYPVAPATSETTVSIRDVLMRGATNTATDGWLFGIELNDASYTDHRNVQFLGHFSGTIDNIVSVAAFTVTGTGEPNHHTLSALKVQHADIAVRVTGTAQSVHVTDATLFVINRGVAWITTGVQVELHVLGCLISAFESCMDIQSLNEGLIQNNLFIATQAAVANVQGVILDSSDNVVVTDNVFFNNSGFLFDAIVISGTSDHNNLSDNIFRSATNGVTLSAGVTNNQVINNIFNTITGSNVLDNSTNDTNFTVNFNKSTGRYEFSTGDLSMLTKLNIPPVSNLTLTAPPFNAITVTASMHTLSTFAGAPTQDLVDIFGVSDGDILILKLNALGQAITVKDGVGNIALDNQDFVLGSLEARLTLQYDPNAAIPRWVELSRSPTPNPETFGFLNSGTLTIAAGVINVLGSFYFVDTEGGAATDDLDSIVGLVTGEFLLLQSVSAARVITARDGIGNIQLAGNFVFNNPNDRLLLQRDGVNFVEVSRANT